MILNIFMFLNIRISYNVVGISIMEGKKKKKSKNEIYFAIKLFRSIITLISRIFLTDRVRPKRSCGCIWQIACVNSLIT